MNRRRTISSGKESSTKLMIQLDSDVAKVFSNTASVNALRKLMEAMPETWWRKQESA